MRWLCLGRRSGLCYLQVRYFLLANNSPNTRARISEPIKTNDSIADSRFSAIIISGSVHFGPCRGNQPAAAAAAKSTVKRRSLLRDRVTVADTTPKQMAESMIEVTVPVPPETAPPPATMRPSATSSSHAVPANAKAASSQRHAHSQNKNGSQSSLHPTSDKPNRLGCLEMSQAAQKLLLSEQERLAALRYLACNYVLKGYERRELCKRNAAVARAVEREDLALVGL